MSNQVYANNMEVSCKQAAGKSICAFPDVCMTPPENPATPPGVPVPYPNTGMASDTTDGSSSVKISGQEVMLKNKSYFKRSTGDEAGCAAKKGVVSSTNMGKVYFTTWSMDVKVEGENVVRHLDMTTHNHACPTANEAIPWAHVDAMAKSVGGACDEEKKKIEENCHIKDGDGKPPECPGSLGVSVGEQIEPLKSQTKTGGPSRGEQAGAQAAADANDCTKAMRCFLRPKEPRKDQAACCPGQTPHHVPPDTYFTQAKYQYGQALCICLEGKSQHFGTHAHNHALIDHFAETHDLKDAAGKSKGPLAKQKPAKLNDAITVCALAVFEQCGCEPGCIEAQLTKHFEETQKLPPETTNVKYEKIAGRSAIDTEATKIKMG
jgi:hypothetical protein